MNRYPSLVTPPKNGRKWSIWRKLAVFPLIPVIGLVALCIWVVIDETNSPPRMIDGRPDNAPRRAAAYLMIATPFLYFAYLGGLVVIRFAFEYIKNRFKKSA